MEEENGGGLESPNSESSSEIVAADSTDNGYATSSQECNTEMPPPPGSVEQRQRQADASSSLGGLMDIPAQMAHPHLELSHQQIVQSYEHAAVYPGRLVPTGAEMQLHHGGGGRGGADGGGGEYIFVGYPPPPGVMQYPVPVPGSNPVVVSDHIPPPNVIPHTLVNVNPAMQPQ